MPLLIWKPAYAIGIPSVDFEHRDLICKINEIYVTIGDEHSPGALATALGNIHSSISAHFALEERFMRESAYAEYKAHKNSHEELLEQLREMMDLYTDDPAAGRDALQRGLSDWFGQHFSTFDARLHRDLPH